MRAWGTCDVFNVEADGLTSAGHLSSARTQFWSCGLLLIRKSEIPGIHELQLQPPRPLRTPTPIAPRVGSRHPHRQLRRARFRYSAPKEELERAGETRLSFKQILIDTLKPIVALHQKMRLRVSDEMVSTFMSS